ncbi:unannotated protein [freshwater metagenome]|uniref:Unannotated protein n=1 Tax=freshwater metagenome TaxID=449393 RepID=A0A6J7HS53_9ZZZZ
MDVRETVVLVAVQNRQIAHRRLRRGDHCIEKPSEPLREDLDRAVVEQISGVEEAGRQACTVGLLVQGQGQIEFGGLDIDVDGGNRQIRQVKFVRWQVLECQRHLEQGMTCGRPFWFEHVDQPLERDVCMSECLEVDLANVAEKLGEGAASIDIRSQNQGIDEHTDHIVQNGLTASGDGCAHCDVVGVGHPREEQSEGAVHDHEERGSGRTSQLDQRRVQLRFDVELESAARVGLQRRTRPIVGQCEFAGQVCQRASPVLRLRGHHAARVGVLTEYCALPQREVCVLHRQRFPPWDLACCSGHVGGHDVAGQRSHRPAVCADVMDHENQYVFAVGDVEQPGPKRRGLRHVEALGRETRQIRDDIVGRGGGRGQIRCHRCSGQDHLMSGTVRTRVNGAQCLVPVEHVRDCRLQGRHIQRSGQPDGHRNVVHRGVGLESVEEPHPLLRQ